MPQFSDDFSGGYDTTTKWQSEVSTNATFNAASGALVITVADGTVGEGRARTQQGYDMDEADADGVEVALSNVVNNARFAVVTSAGDGYACDISGGTSLNFGTMATNAYTQQSGGLTYNATTHAKFRIRFSATHVFFDTWDSGTPAWTQRYTRARTVGPDHTAMRVVLRSSNGGSSPARTSTWDNVVVAGVGVTGPTSGFTAAVDMKTVTLTNTSVAGTNPITATTVDWGDGTVNSLLVHQYAVGGLYTVTLTSSDGTLTDDFEDDVTTTTRYLYTVTTVGGRSASITADRPDA